VINDKAKYEEAKRKGICTRCGKFHGTVYVKCSVCRAICSKYNTTYNIQYRKRLIEEGRCKRCATPLYPETDAGLQHCINCRDYQYLR